MDALINALLPLSTPPTIRRAGWTVTLLPPSASVHHPRGFGRPI